MIGPLMFGFIMDRGGPKWVFGGSAGSVYRNILCKYGAETGIRR
jgi:hypothetical protein